MTDLEALYLDPTAARIAQQARALDELAAACRTQGRTVPASVLDAIEDLWRWADGDLIPRGRRPRHGRLTGPYRDIPLPGMEEPFALQHPA